MFNTLYNYCYNYLYKMNTNKELFSKMTNKEYSGHKKKVYTLGWSLHGSKLASGSADNNIRVNNLNK